MKEIKLIRISSEDDSTIGALYDESGHLLCFCLEDEQRAVKVFGETCIPNGRYRLKLRNWGANHEKYALKYPLMHEGMIEITNVPGFTDILIHQGNTDGDTLGCVLVGTTVTENRFRNGVLANSAIAYERIYPIICELIQAEDTYLVIKDISK